MEFIQTDQAARPAGHYSQGVKAEGLVFVSGQLAVDQDGVKHNEASIEKQTEVALSNVERILEAAGCTLQDLVSVTIYITDIAHWAAVNAVYSQRLGHHKPARAIVPVSPLHFGFLIEIQGIARAR
jgi:2-iminobutanoate/2-iminopropanoate deaminase